MWQDITGMHRQQIVQFPYFARMLQCAFRYAWGNQSAATTILAHFSTHANERWWTYLDAAEQEELVYEQNVFGVEFTAVSIEAQRLAIDRAQNNDDRWNYDLAAERFARAFRFDQQTGEVNVPQGPPQPLRTEAELVAWLTALVTNEATTTTITTNNSTSTTSAIAAPASNNVNVARDDAQPRLQSPSTTHAVATGRSRPPRHAPDPAATVNATPHVNQQEKIRRQRATFLSRIVNQVGDIKIYK